MKYFVILLASLLIGCTSAPVATIVDKKVHIDSAVLEPCALIPNTKINSIEDVLLENIDLYTLYATCAKKQDNSVLIIKEFGNIK